MLVGAKLNLVFLLLCLIIVESSLHLFNLRAWLRHLFLGRGNGLFCKLLLLKLLELLLLLLLLFLGESGPRDEQGFKQPLPYYVDEELLLLIE